MGTKRKAKSMWRANAEISREAMAKRRKSSPVESLASDRSDGADDGERAIDNDVPIEYSIQIDQPAPNQDALYQSEQNSSNHQTKFRVGTLPHSHPSAVESLYFKWKIATTAKEIDDPDDINQEDDVEGGSDLESANSSDNGEDQDDQICNVHASGQPLDMETSDISPIPRPDPRPSHIFSSHPTHLTPSPTLPPFLEYQYSEFISEPNRHQLAEVHLVPNQTETMSALTDLEKILSNARTVRGSQSKDSELDMWQRVRIEGMASMLRMFTNQQSATYNQWGPSACQTAIGMGRGVHCARQLCELNRSFLADRNILPLNPYADWNKSLLVNENILNEITIFLLSLGNDITATKLMHFLHRKDIKEKYGIEKDIVHKTACRYLQALGYCYQSTPKGQYVDGHKREDVVTYQNNVFLPKWKKFTDRMATWDKNLKEYPPPSSEGRRVIVWFHDKSIFYANDRRKKGWYHKDASPKPYAKGEGSSLMIAHFVSADFGWLNSPDGQISARCLFKPGKHRDGYFSSEDIINQTDNAINICKEFYPDFDHVFVFDNATTHLKRPDDALSARNMPKNIPKPGKNWGVEATKRDPLTGKIIYKADGKPEKIKILMRDAQFADGTPQPLYFPMDHPNPDLQGQFKGMAVILEERGFRNISNLSAQCKGFKCAPGSTDCCCRRILYNQPDFANAESMLELHCHSRGVKVLFLPKFHCELNFIEQCWGQAKSVYHTYPPSSQEQDLERNTLTSLDSIPLPMMRKFAIRSRRFMSAYERGLNGKQAVWAARKYQGHRVLLENIIEEMQKEGVD